MTVPGSEIARRDDSTGPIRPYRDLMRRWVPRTIDLATAAVLTVVTQVELWLLDLPDVSLAVVAPSFVVGTLAFAWHRLAPLTALTVGLTALVVVPGALGIDPALAFGWFVTAFALMASAGYHARRPLVALAIALGLLALSIVLQKGLVLSDVLYAWLLGGAFWLAGRALASRTLRAELSEQRATAAEEQAQWRAAVAVADERLRIAREMHDVVSHSISVMTLHVSGVRRLLRPEQADERAALETVERTGRESLAEMQRMLGVLRAPDEEGGSPSPGIGRLPELLEPVRGAGLDARLTVDGDVQDLAPGIGLAAYRIAQEAVTNVLRHAQARHLDLFVRLVAGSLELTVADDGRGGPARRQGHGLVGMCERAAAYGGTVEAGPRPDGGWTVHASLPVPLRVAEEAP
jgi:signal transduction histidine kinase